MDREQVAALALNARTLNGIILAEQNITDWMQAHPDDLAMYEVAGMVGILKEAAQERQNTTTAQRRQPQK